MNFNDEHALETYKSLISISTEALKALQLVNGGAVVALLAYLGQASDRATLAVQIKCPMAFFVLGLVTATATFIPSYLTQLALYNEDIRSAEYKGVRHQTWLNVALLLALISLVAFAVGAFVAISALAHGAGK